jgi:3-oxoacyl-[acyl-carrier protein] reductase
MIQSVPIVTGASQGIGRATSIRLARDFSAIVLAARNAAALAEAATAVKSAGAEPLICDVDLSKPEASETLIKATLDRFDRIDALLNIAGAAPQIDLLEMTDEQWQAGMELKLHGARRVTIRAWDALKASHGSVAFMSGSAALDPPEQVGISRYGQPEEIAEILGFMVSPAARWMTGTSVRMDGGEIKSI